MVYDDVHVTALPNPQASVEHLHGAHALPRVAEALVQFEPSVLMTSDGRGAIYAPDGDNGPSGDQLWLLADARRAHDWEASRDRAVTLTFHSKDEHVFLTLSGSALVVSEPGLARALWRPSFEKWFQGGPDDAKLLIVQFTAADAEFCQAPFGRVSAHLEH